MKFRDILFLSPKCCRAQRCIAVQLSTLAPMLASAQSVSIDTSFYPEADSSVTSMALQPDGKILVGGNFSMLSSKSRSHIGRLNADGSLDSAFNPGADALVYSLALQADGRILVAGRFTSLAGQTCNYLGRLNADGSLDSAFNPGVNSYVYSLALQPDGKILVGGNFTSLGGQPRSRIGWLHVDGSLDKTFDPGAGASVSSFALQPDGKILVGGAFTTLGGENRFFLGRLNADGSLDNGFDPGANSLVYALAVQVDGKIVVGGDFTKLGGVGRDYLGRLNVDGSLDSSFKADAGGVNYPDVQTIALQTDGKILVGGSFTTLGGARAVRTGRLNPDGKLDGTFNIPANSYVYSLALQPDGKILVGGEFTSIDGRLRNSIARLNNNGAALQDLSYDGSQLVWMRRGSSPELGHATFELSTNAVDWVMLGEGSRVADTWQLRVGALPFKGVVRARGRVAGGLGNSSGWFVETTLINLKDLSPMILPASMLRPTNGLCQFRITGTPGQKLEIQTSTDLVNWTSASPATVSNDGTVDFSQQGANQERRFYRVKVQ